MIDRKAQAEVLEAASFFRNVLDCMARPGRIHHFVEPGDDVDGLFATTFSIIRTLCDYQTPVWLCPDFNTPEIRKAVRFATGAPLTADIAAASFAVSNAHLNNSSMGQLAIGTHEYPDRSATLIHQVSGLSNTGGMTFTGPGIKTRINLSVDGVAQDFWAFMHGNHQLFPLGVDVIFASRTGMAACPRSTAIKSMEPV